MDDDKNMTYMTKPDSGSLHIYTESGQDEVWIQLIQNNEIKNEIAESDLDYLHIQMESGQKWSSITKDD